MYIHAHIHMCMYIYIYTYVHFIFALPLSLPSPLRSHSLPLSSGIFYSIKCKAFLPFLHPP